VSYLACLVVASATAASALAADEVHLADGRVLDGEVVSAAGADPIDLRTAIGGMVVVQHFAASQVLRVVPGKSARQAGVEAIQAERKRLDDQAGAEAWWQLTERARDLGEAVLARELAGEVITRDRQHAAARKLLGMTQYRGVWMRSHEAAAARGEVFHNGRWLGWDERERQLIEIARREEDLRQARVADQSRREAAGYSYDGLAGYPAPTVVPGYNYGGGYSGGYYGSGSGYGGYGGMYSPFFRRPVTLPSGGSSVVGGSSVTVRAGAVGRKSAFEFNWGY